MAALLGWPTSEQDGGRGVRRGINHSCENRLRSSLGQLWGNRYTAARMITEG